MPILVITDIMCRVGPIVHARCPSAAQNRGVLPRIGEPNEHGMRQVHIPDLASLGKHYHSADQGAEPVQQEKCTQKNVYNLLRDSAPAPPAQRLDFGQLLDMSASTGPNKDNAADFVLLARGCLRELHRQSHRSMNLFEVVAVLNARFTNLADIIAQEQQGGPPPTAALMDENGEEQSGSASVLNKLLAYSVFSTRVLAVATGSTVGTAPTLPAFSGHLCSPAIGENDVRRAALEVLVLAYAKVGGALFLSFCIFHSRFVVFSGHCLLLVLLCFVSFIMSPSSVYLISSAFLFVFSVLEGFVPLRSQFTFFRPKPVLGFIMQTKM